MKVILLSILVLLSSNVYADILEDQQLKIAERITDYYKSANTVAEEMFVPPPSSEEAACLGDLNSLNFDVVSFDPSPFGVASQTAYDSLLQQVRDQACSATSDYVNEATAKVATTIQSPVGLGEISVTQGSNISDWSEVIETDVQLSNTELLDQINEADTGNAYVDAGVNEAVDEFIVESEVTDKNPDDIEEETGGSKLFDFVEFFNPLSSEDEE